jgi:O-antigen/teichoic acid export membrane protein
MTEIKKLASQTAYYGISSILGRVLNFLLLPLYTSQLAAVEYGTVTYLYSFIALFNIIYTYGLETGFFRFTTKQKDASAFHSTGTAVLITSVLFSGLLIFGAPTLSNALGKGVESQFIIYLALILFIDAIVAIPFAKLRLENRPVKFALIRLSVILLTIGLNLLFLIVFPDISEGKYLNGLQEFVNTVYDPQIGIGYIFIANLMSNALYLPLLWKEFAQLRLKINWAAFKPILAYSFPVFLMGLAGMFNEQGYALIMPNIEINQDSLSGTEALGVYTGAFKLSVIMMLGIQAFRYAGEPFFFSHTDNKEAPALFARIMHYFVIFNLVVMVGVALNIDLIADVFLGRPEYKGALYVLPILLLAKLFYGIYVNLSVWFKIKDKTIFGTYFAAIGTVITIVGNLILIPMIGFMGTAFTALTCYIVMCVLCYNKGRQFFKVPYDFKPLIGYLALALVFIYVGQIIQPTNQWLNYGVSLAISGMYVLLMYFFEGKKLKYKSSDNAG